MCSAVSASAIGAHRADDQGVPWQNTTGGPSPRRPQRTSRSPTANDSVNTRAACSVLAIWPAASGVPTPRAGWVAAGAMSALLAWFGTELGGERVGFAERVAAAAESLWPLAAVALTARRRPVRG